MANSDQMPGPDNEPNPVRNFQFDLTEKRKKHFTNLKPSVTYYFYYYAVNAAGVSSAECSGKFDLLVGWGSGG